MYKDDKIQIVAWIPRDLKRKLKYYCLDNNTNITFKEFFQEKFKDSKII